MRPIAGPAPTPAAAAGVSDWQSPVPYLFGGLAAMMGLIALALLILACSYWKLNSYLSTGRASSSSSTAGGSATDGDGSKSPAAAAPASPAAFADLVAVVMAGEKIPTFLAAPVLRRLAAGGEDSPETTENGKSRGKEEEGGEASQQLDQV